MSVNNRIYTQWLALLLFMVAGCRSNDKVNKSFPELPGYYLSEPVIIHLKSEMEEISGLHFYAKDSSVFAVNDEAGFLYKIYIREKIKIEKWSFSQKADYEDITLLDSTFYALKSKGDIAAFRFFSVDSLQHKEYNNDLSGSNEFESLYVDSASRKVVMLCKDCEADKKSSVTAYAFDPATNTFDKAPFYILDVKSIAKKLGLDKMKFKPSASAIHPITHDLYIISAINKAIVVATLDGKIKNAYNIDPDLFKQPEGMTFTPWGDLLISNEAADVGSPNILIFRYNAKKE